MHLTRTTTAVFVLALFSRTASVHAVFSTSAGYSYSGVARAHPDLNQLFSGDLTNVKVGGDPFEFNTIEQSFLKVANGDRGVAEANGSLLAVAAMGILRAKVDFTLQATNSVPSFGTNTALTDVDFASAKAGWRDRITTRTSELPIGIALKVEAVFSISGTLLAAASGDGCCARAQAHADIRDHNGAMIFSRNSVQTVPPQPGDGSDDPNVEIVLPLIVVNGFARDIGFTLEVSGEGYANRGHLLATPTGVSTSIFMSDYTNTARWGGIRNVVVADTGAPVPNWTIESESGFDYSKPYPVPEPCSLALASGLAIFWRRHPSAGRNIRDRRA
jgi:hypothetical protein